MADVLIRGLSDDAVARIDSDAAALGLSRQEYLRRRFEVEGTVTRHARRVSIEDLRRAATAAADLEDSGVMDAAWQ